MKSLFSAFVFASIVCLVSIAEAQWGGPPGANQQNFNNNQNQRVRNQVANNQNMPTIQELAQLMIINFDADGSGELGQAELQSALDALKQMMQNQAGNQNQLVGQNQQNGLVNQQNAQQQANRPPPRGRR